MLENARNTLVSVVILLALGLVFAVGFLWANGRAQKEIGRVEAQREQLEEQRVMIQSLATKNDSLQREMDVERVRLTQEVDQREAVIDSLESEQQVQGLTVRRLRTTEALAEKFESTFPEIADTDWGVHEVYNEEFGVAIEYASVPSRTLETFIVEHQRLQLTLEEIDTLKSIVSLEKRISEVTDSMLTLERSSRTAFQQGYDSAYVAYGDVSAKYIAELQKPDFKLTLGNMGLLVATLVAGYGLGAVTQ